MSDIITLKALCAELKIDPREAREKLRAAVSDAKANPELAKARKPRTPWQWVKSSESEQAARKILS
jgi:outer membrane murein-binding lipoprotein Lpp